MKYIKNFENVNYKIGDYALFNYTGVDYAHGVRMTSELRDFINSNAGEIITISDTELHWIEVRYDDIPKNIENKFHHNKILLWKKYIVATSSDFEDLETYRQSKKYNL